MGQVFYDFSEPQFNTHHAYRADLKYAITEQYGKLLSSIATAHSNSVHLDTIEEGEHAFAARVLVNLEPIGFIRARYGARMGEVDVCVGPAWKAYYSVWDSPGNLEEL